MSETKDPRRTRRRASRTAGPPVEGAAEQVAGKSSATAGGGVETAAGKSASAATGASVAAGKPEDVTERIGTVAEPGDADATERIDTVAGSGDADATVRIDKSAAGTGAGAPVEAGEKSDAADATVSMKKTAAASPASASTPPEPAVQGGSGSWKRVAALAAAAVLVIGLVAAAVVSMVAVQSTEQRDERRSEYVATARQTILNLTTIRADTAEEDIDRILTMASGEFKTEFDGRIDPFTEIVKQAQVRSTGEVVEAAVERDDEKSAVILVAAKQTLTNAGAEGEQQRFYRFRVTVQRGDDGTLTASDVEFVA